ncbi:Similar to hypothetical protein RO3G_14072 [Rhizopus oryzae RA 99-880]; acc. no. EIE89361 [Pyronema omphalodes CBS 100304]|uniref:Uncharacterized protein n=1 Tax=Pyronema omphalodes (strain CBS 100304) TaxID=1076935 RepID=U4LH03_PYROM|nr:Similar to hypothetical protein RO3G_14072 [Rhizopus oryzae RA 99-880]; acc. no. EIE89361 [Pyronema omphalodes CBS 100304]
MSRPSRYLGFWGDISEHINDEARYQEFLGTLNTYGKPHQLGELLDAVYPFIGDNPALFAEFKQRNTVSPLTPDTSPLRSIDNLPIDKCNPVFFAAVKQYFGDLGHKWRYIKFCKTLETHAQGQLDEKMMVDRVKELIGSKQELWDEFLRLWDIEVTPPSQNTVNHPTQQNNPGFCT